MERAARSDGKKVAMRKNRKALGRGIESLIPQKRKNTQDEGESFERVEEIAIDKIDRSRYQPRVKFDEEAIGRLAESISSNGLAQPLLARRLSNGRYELIAGERRLRALEKLGRATAPTLIRTTRDSESLQIALIENIQREDLNPLEVALAYRRLIDQFGMRQDELAGRVGASRPAVSNMLRLLKLPEEIKGDLLEGRLTMGHARALLALDSDEARLKERAKILSANLNVRATEERARAARSTSENEEERARASELKRLTARLEGLFGLKTTLKSRKGGGGSIELKYRSDADLDRIFQIFGQVAQSQRH